MARHVRKIGGEYYHLKGTWARKSVAKGAARAWRKTGYKARVAKTKDGYSVYAQKQ